MFCDVAPILIEVVNDVLALLAYGNAVLIKFGKVNVVTAPDWSVVPAE
jgi:hypothetical protein